MHFLLKDTYTLSMMFQLAIPIEYWVKGAHVRFEFRHRSSSDKTPKLLAFGFLMLISNDDTTIANEQHEVYLYKVRKRDI